MRRRCAPCRSGGGCGGRGEEHPRRRPGGGSGQPARIVVAAAGAAAAAAAAAAWSPPPPAAAPKQPAHPACPPASAPTRVGRQAGRRPLTLTLWRRRRQGGQRRRPQAPSARICTRCRTCKPRGVASVCTPVAVLLTAGSAAAAACAVVCASRGVVPRWLLLLLLLRRRLRLSPGWAGRLVVSCGCCCRRRSFVRVRLVGCLCSACGPPLQQWEVSCSCVWCGCSLRRQTLC